MGKRSLFLGMGSVGIATAYALKSNVNFNVSGYSRGGKAGFKSYLLLTEKSNIKMPLYLENDFSLRDMAKPDCIFLSAKATFNNEYIELIENISMPDSILFLLQNGFRNSIQFKSKGYKGRVVDTVVKCCCTKQELNSVLVDTWPEISLDSNCIDKSILQLLMQTKINGKDLFVSKDKSQFEIESIEKYAFVIAVSSFSILKGLPCNRILSSPSYIDLFKSAVYDFAELHAYSHCFKYCNLDAVIEKYLSYLETISDSFFPSMYLDLRNGLPSEYHMFFDRNPDALHKNTFLNVYNVISSMAKEV